MPGWRVGFCCGNKKLVQALTKIKSYMDYGTFTPIQVAAIKALNDCDQEVINICSIYKSRRDELCNGLNRIGWDVQKPLATMFIWAKIPDKYLHLGSLEFSKLLIKHANVAVSPGAGFGINGDEYVRFSLIENEHRIRQAIRGIKNFFNGNKMKSLNIGICGWGNVATGMFKALNDNADVIKLNSGCSFEVKVIGARRDNLNAILEIRRY